MLAERTREIIFPELRHWSILMTTCIERLEGVGISRSIWNRIFLYFVSVLKFNMIVWRLAWIEVACDTIYINLALKCSITFLSPSSWEFFLRINIDNSVWVYKLFELFLLLYCGLGVLALHCITFSLTSLDLTLFCILLIPFLNRSTSWETNINVWWRVNIIDNSEQLWPEIVLIFSYHSIIYIPQILIFVHYERGFVV